MLPGWNLISLPGQPLEPDPQSLVGDSETAMLPMFRWNPTGFSYQEVTELKFGEGYWILSLNPDGETLHVPVSPVTSYSRPLSPGWNMIGSVSGEADFTNPQDEPDNSIIAGSLYSWNPNSYKYVRQSKIEPNKGYWVLTLANCQLTVTEGYVFAAPPPLVNLPQLMVPLYLKSGQFNKQLVIGMDQQASISLDDFDQLMPPVSPMKTDIEAYFDRDKVNWDLQSDIQPLQDTVEWRLVVRSEETTDLSVDTSTLPESYQLIVVTETSQYEMGGNQSRAANLLGRSPAAVGKHVRGENKSLQ